MKIYFLLVGTLASLLPLTALATTLGLSSEMTDEVGGGVIGFLTPILEYVILILLVVALLVIIIVIKKFGGGMMSQLFRYFSTATALLIVMRLFIHLVELEVISVASGALHFWWHVIFYLAMLSFFFGLKGMVDLADGREDKMAKMVSKWQLTSIVAVLAIVFLSITTGNSWASFYDNSLLEGAGLHHFIAFAISVLVVYYLIQSKKKIGMIGAGIAMPLTIGLSFWGFQHFWELLTESWKILTFTDEVIEHVEQYLVVIAVISLIYSFVQLKKATTVKTT